MTIRIVPFARLRDIIGAPLLERTFARDATAAELWQELAREFPPLVELGPSTRFVRDGAFVEGAAHLHDGDEVGLLPPFGGG